MDAHQQHGGGMPLPYYQLQDNVNVPEKAAQYAVGMPPHTSSQQQLTQFPPSTFEPYHPPQPTKSTGATVLSVKRSVALITLAVLLFLFLAVIGLSAGLGISQHKYRQTKSDLETMEAFLSSAIAAVPTAEAKPSANPEPTPSSVVPSASATKSSSISSSSPSATAAVVSCPGSNNTVYTVESTGQRFNRLCGVDYSGNNEAVDVGNVKTSSLELCIEACAKRSDCEGAGWGVVLEEKRSALHSCWMKKNLKKFHDAKRPDWGFAVLLDDDE